MTDKYEALKSFSSGKVPRIHWVSKEGDPCAVPLVGVQQEIKELISERDALAAKLAEMEAQEPVAWFVKEYGDVEGVEWNTQKPKSEGDWKPLFRSPGANPDKQDAERYRWLRAQHWTENTVAVVLRPKDNTVLGTFLPYDSLLDSTIDAAIEGAKK